MKISEHDLALQELKDEAFQHLKEVILETKEMTTIYELLTHYQSHREWKKSFSKK